jgi:hypothetical protein
LWLRLLTIQNTAAARDTEAVNQYQVSFKKPQKK